jgi:hypothetical protein
MCYDGQKILRDCERDMCSEPPEFEKVVFWYTVIVAVCMDVRLSDAWTVFRILFKSSFIMGQYLVNINMPPLKIEARPHFG